jgi:hypothetical protein
MVAMRKTAWDLPLDGNRSSSSTSSNDNVDASLQAAYRQAHVSRNETFFKMNAFYFGSRVEYCI